MTRSPLPLLAFLTVLINACTPLGLPEINPFPCGHFDINLPTFSRLPTRNSESEGWPMTGVCGSASCDEEAPLSVGARHEVVIEIDPSGAPFEIGEQLSLRSSDAKVVRVDEVDVRVEVRDWDDGDTCQQVEVRFVRAQIDPIQPGRAKLQVVDEDGMLDEYPLVISATDEAHLEVGEPGETHQVGPDGLALEVGEQQPLTVVATDAMGRALVLSTGNVSGAVDPASLVELERSGGDRQDVVDFALEGLAPGTGTLRVDVAGLSFDVPIVVADPKSVDARAAMAE